MLEFRVLGALEVHGSAGEVALGGAMQRLALALLVLQAGQFVSREALVDGLWPESPPPTATHAVESYISRLRGLLKAAGATGPVVEFAPAGYRLTRDGSRFDHLAFGTLADDARVALARDDYPAASAFAHEALGLWRGPALAGLASEPALLAEAATLDEQRVGAFELWAAAELGLGRHAGLIATLIAEAQRHPTRERLQELVMLALYRAGRQAEALDVYRATRRHLVDELGLEPGPALRELEERILRHDRSLAPGPALPPASPATPAVARAPRAARRHVTALALVGCLVAAGAIAALIARHDGGDAAAIAATLRTPAIGRLDAVNGRRRSAAGLPASAGRLATGMGATWATSYDDGTLLRIDPKRLTVTQTIAVGHGPSGVAVAGGDIWVANTLDNTLTRVDGATNTIVQRIPVGTAPTDVAAGAGAIWVANSRAASVSRVDPRTGTVTRTAPLRSAPAGLAVGAGSVWVAESEAGTVARLDARSGHLRQTIRVGSGPSAIVAGRDGVWVANRLDSTVSLIDPTRDAVRLTRDVVGVPTALAAAGSGLWVGTEDTRSLTQIRASGARREVKLPSPASALAADAGGLLVGVRGLGLDHRGGTLTARASYGFTSISPYACCDTPPAFRASSYDSLLAFSRAPGSVSTLVPDLAVQIPRAEAGGRVYRFRLRSGLRYWTGAPVRAADVRRGLERAARSNLVFAVPIGALSGATACPRAPRCDLRAAVETNDRERTVTLHLTHADPNLLIALGAGPYAPAPPGSEVPPGTGPYRVARFVPGRLVDLRRNRYFRAWAPTAQPPGYPDRILWRMGRGVTGNVAAVLRGDADYTPDAPTRREHDAILLRSPGQLHVVPLPGLDHLILNTRMAPFDDVRVRRALNFAVDRRTIAGFFGGTESAMPICQVLAATVAGHEPYCPYTRRASVAGRWIGPDLARARRLIAASRTQDSPVRILVASGSPTDGRSARYFAGLLRRLGYPAHVRPVRQDRWVPVLAAAHPPQAVMTAWYSYPSAGQWIGGLLSCAGWNPPVDLRNQARFCDRVVDRWADEAARLAATNPGASNRLWSRADRRITDQAPWVSTVTESSTDVVSRRTGNYQQLAGSAVSLDQLWVR
ncbi:MAG: peptide/nickel transport system substrate-binding protein [Solirubrobacteraceae bacterium]|nr:peptide/nickel transport system substrate-binding protein [Solirubrobacteraceae bacterium]